MDTNMSTDCSSDTDVSPPRNLFRNDSDYDFDSTRQRSRRKRQGKESRQKQNDKFYHKIAHTKATAYQIQLLSAYFSPDEIDENGRLKPPAESSPTVLTDIVEVEVSAIALQPIAEAVCTVVESTDDDEFLIEEAACVYRVLSTTIDTVLDENEFNFHDTRDHVREVIELPTVVGYYVNAFNGYVTDEGIAYSPRLYDGDDFEKLADSLTPKNDKIGRLYRECALNTVSLEAYSLRMKAANPKFRDKSYALRWLELISQPDENDFAMYHSIVERFKARSYGVLDYHFTAEPTRGGNDVIKWIQLVHSQGITPIIDSDVAPPDRDFGYLFMLRPRICENLSRRGKVPYPTAQVYAALFASPTLP